MFHEFDKKRVFAGDPLTIFICLTSTKSGSSGLSVSDPPWAQV